MNRKMTAEEVASYCREHVRSFTNPEVIGSGSAYHYTSNYTAIEALKRFLGVPLSPDLDCCQTSIPSPPATADPGVVFAYEDLEAAKEEGSGCDIVKVDFSAAVKVPHEQETQLHAPPTIIIVNTDIVNYSWVCRAE